MTASLKASSDGTQAIIQVGGVDKVTVDAGGIASGYKDASITPAKLSGGQSGSAPAFVARAWCVFDGTLAGTNVPLAGGNVTNVTKTGTGTYTVNLSTALSDTNACVQVNCNRNSFAQSNAGNMATTSTISVSTAANGAAIDQSVIQVVVFR